MANQSAFPQPLIAVKNVEASSKWYTHLLDGSQLKGGSDHDHIYNRIYCDDSLVLQLHSWDDEDHPNLVNRAKAQVGHGVLLWFQVSDFDDSVKRVTKLKAKVLEEPHENPYAKHHEIWIEDPDGYIVVLAG